MEQLWQTTGEGPRLGLGASIAAKRVLVKPQPYRPVYHIIIWEDVSNNLVRLFCGEKPSSSNKEHWLHDVRAMLHLLQYWPPL